MTKLKKLPIQKTEKHSNDNNFIKINKKMKNQVITNQTTVLVKYKYIGWALSVTYFYYLVFMHFKNKKHIKAKIV